ncbi:hypothetical protein AVEN_275345-1, partial [Araneus ventricosus]
SIPRFLEQGKGKPFVNVRTDENWRKWITLIEFRIVRNQIGISRLLFDTSLRGVAGEQNLCLDGDSEKRLSHAERKRGNLPCGECGGGYEYFWDIEPPQQGLSEQTLEQS